MKDEITIDEARELVLEPVLWPLVRNFLWDFAPQVHESWLEGIVSESSDTGQGPAQSLVSSLSTSPRVKKFVLGRLGVEPCFHTFPKDDWSRLALLDGATLFEIVKWLGALACVDELRRVTSGATVRELKAALPGIYPEVFGYTEYFRKLKVEKLEVEGSLPDAIEKLGCGMLHSFLGELPAPLWHRMLLKLPHNLEPSTPDLQPSNLQPSNMQLLLKLRFPEAYTLCCS